MPYIDEELTAARARVRELEAQLESLAATCATLRNLLTTPMLVASDSTPDPLRLRTWLDELPERVRALPPPLHLSRGKVALPS